MKSESESESSNHPFHPNQWHNNPFTFDDCFMEPYMNQHHTLTDYNKQMITHMHKFQHTQNHLHFHHYLKAIQFIRANNLSDYKLERIAINQGEWLLTW